MTGATDPVLLDWPASGVARLRINRPASRNAIDGPVRSALLHQLSELAAEGVARALVLGGVQGVFSAGGDLPSMRGLDDAGARARLQEVAAICRSLAGIGLPVVSAVEGVAAGGAVGLALLGDRIVVGENTRLMFPFLRLGLVPDWGQLFTLAQRVGNPRARQILTAGESLKGEAALRLGVADLLVADANVMEKAIELAVSLASLPRDAHARLKGSLRKPPSSLEEALQQEEEDQVVCLLGAEFEEGYAAFTDKRPANFVRIGTQAARKGDGHE